MTDRYIKLFEWKEYILQSLLPLGDLRKQAIKDFKSLGFPHNKMEKWRNFNLNDFKKIEFAYDLGQMDLDLRHLKPDSVLENEDFFVMHNGSISSGMQLRKYKNGVIFGSVREAMIKYPQLVKKYFNKANKQTMNGFNALNTAFCFDGFFLYVPEKVEVELPFAIVNFFLNDFYNMVSPRNIIVLEKESKASLVTIESSVEYDKQFVNSITEVFLEENSRFEWDRLQQFQGKTIVINPVFVEQKENSSFNKTISTVRGYKVRNDIHDELSGENSTSVINGVYILDDDDMVENRVFLDHKVPNCNSNQLFKGVLDGKSVGAFTGYVLVRQDSQKTNAFQSNKNIVMSEDAKINTNPFLEIYADDVKCSHGASVGNLDENALFYMQARGIDKKKAKDILLSAFALDALENMKNENFKKLVSLEIERALVNK